MAVQPRIAYDVQVIHDCIVRDTDVSRTYDTKAKKLALYREKAKLLDGQPKLKAMIDAGFVSSLDPKRGKYVGWVGWLPTGLVITDQRIREMCRNMFSYSPLYVERTGLSYGPCPGLEKMSGCPMFSPKPAETRARLDQADIFIAMQSIYFEDEAPPPAWHDIILLKLQKEIEKVEGKGSITAAYGAGPCQLCAPKPCLGKGECRAPEKHHFSVESVGIPVLQLCRDLALVTGDEGWKFKFIKYYNTPRQTHSRYKFTCGVAVKLK